MPGTAARPLEVLSPAADADTGICAFDHGADAVYIGGPAFGARHAAGNPLEDIARMAAYGHRFGARTYLTLNTLVLDSEFEAALALARGASEASVDALIVQDLGLMAAIRREIPGLPVHASTQCDISTPQKAAFLASMGCSQLVLARELAIDEIPALAKAAPQCRLEYFVHGALCVSMSGLCLASASLGAGSANRGCCTQPCRLAWRVTDRHGTVLADSHVLSLKDNNQSANLLALARAGVSSFKIEGRLKDSGYVRNVTAWYRALVDRIIAEHPGEFCRASEGDVRPAFTPDPSRSFNRGFTDYFARGRQADIGSFETPKSTGRPAGRVTAAAGNVLEIEGAGPFANGDGFVWTDSAGELRGFQANRAESLGRNRWRLVLRRPERGLVPGCLLRRNRDTIWEKEIARSQGCRSLAVSMQMQARHDGLELAVRDAAGHTGHASLAAPVEPASSPQAGQRLKEALTKTGGTAFRASPQDVKICGFVPFVPAARLNALRREALGSLESARLASRLREVPGCVDPKVPYPDPRPGCTANCANSHTEALLRARGVIAIEPAFEVRRPEGPVTVMRCRHCIRKSLGICWKDTGIHPEPLTLTHGRKTLTAVFHCRECEMHIVAGG